MHHKDPTRAWSIFIRDLLLTRNTYHGVWGSERQVSSQDADVLLQGLHMLIERGINKYKQGVDPKNLVILRDIREVFTALSGGRTYTLSDDRTVLEWWQQGSSTGIASSQNFDARLQEFNKRIKYLMDNKQDYESLVNHLYPTLGLGWMDKGRLQMDTYLLMKNHPYAI